MTGRKASTANDWAQRPVELTGLAAYSGTLKWRRSPVSASDAGAILVPVEPGVVMPDHLGNAIWRPATPSGAPELRCGGLIAATASSTVTASVLNAWERRICSVRS